MIQYTLRLSYGDSYRGEDFFFEIESEIEMPVFPREGEIIFIGGFEDNEHGDYCEIAQVWHHPTKKQVIAEVELGPGYIWLAVEAWRKMPGNWRINEQSNGVQEKFLYFVEHPDELQEHKQ